MLPADQGDCLWIEYGDQAKPKRILIDAGTKHSYPALERRLESLPRAERVFELLVVTHIDVDHIGGVLPLLKNAHSLGVRFNDVWFNGYSHLERATADDSLGALQGEELSARLVKLGWNWNRAFGGEPIVTPADGPLPVADVADMKITILSPRVEELKRLREEWESTVEAAGLVPGVEIRRDPDEIDDLLGEEIDVPTLADSRFKSDTSRPNGSSIAFVAEFDRRSVLFGADAFPGVLTQGLLRVPPAERASITTLKVPHHGSRKNTSKEFLEPLSCKLFLFSSNGQQFSHPNRESVARVIQRKSGAALKFNYRTEFNECWDDEELMHSHRYEVEYGDEIGLAVDIPLRQA